MNRSRLVHVHEDPAWGKASIYAPADEIDTKSDIKTKSPLIASELRAKPEDFSVCPPEAQPLRSPSEEELQGNENVDEQSAEHNVTDLHQSIPALHVSGLSYLEASLFATVVEDVITQMRILAESNNNLRVEKVHSDFPKLRALKFGVEKAVVVNELMGFNPYDLNRIEYKLNKLEADRNLLIDLFVKLYTNLSTHYGFEALTDCVKDITEKERQFKQLVDDEAMRRAQYRVLSKQLRQQRNHFKTARYDFDVQIDTLTTAIEDADLMFEIKDRHVAKWQGVRTECHDYLIAEREAFSTDSTEYYKRRADHEQRVHMEAELLTTIITNETLQKVEDLMNKYERDMEEIDLKIQVKRSEWQKLYDKRVYLEEKYARHKKDITDWVKFKDDRTRANEYHTNMTTSAVIVQAWWRGLLVRREMGPFRAKGKPKGKK